MKQRILLVSFFLFTVFKSSFSQYCIPEYENSCASKATHINKFTFHTLSNTNSGCNGNPDNYILYPATGNNTTIVQIGSSYSLSIKSGSGSGSGDQGFGIWIDFNNDEDFEDESEFVYASPIVDNLLFSGTIPIPNEEDYIGQRRLRVRSADESLIYAENSCSEFENGETEDYVITIDPAPACSGTPEAGTVKAFPSAVCTPGESAILELHGYSIASGLTLQWEMSPDGTNWEIVTSATDNVMMTEPLDTNTFFRVAVTCTITSQTAYSNEVMISIGNVELLSVSADSICGAGIATLQAVGTAEEILWYNTKEGGVPVFMSSPPSTFSPSVDSTTTFYVSAASGIVYVDSIGLTDSSGATGSDAFVNGFLKFDVFHSCILVGVYVYPSASGNIYIHLRDEYFTTLEIDTFFIQPSQVNKRVYVPLDFSLEPGNDYQLFLSDESVPLWSTQSDIQYPYDIPGVVSITSSNLGPGYYFYFYNWIINYSDLCESTRTPVTAYVKEALSLSVLSNAGEPILCSNSTDSLELTASSGYLNYSWSPSTGLSSTSGETVKAFPATTTTYTVFASDSVCQNEETITVTVSQAPNITITSSSDSICGGTSAQLEVAVTPLLNYSVSSIEFHPDFIEGVEVILDDEEVSAAQPISFDFNFYGNDYSQFYISSNGFITFDSLALDGCCTGQSLPNINPPNNLIAYAWEDLSPNLGGKVHYITTGVAPERKLLISFDSIPHYSFSGAVDSVTSQIILYETSNIIEIHTTQMPGNPQGNWFFHTEGIENAEGTLGATVPGRNASNQWTAVNDAWRFTPERYSYSWSPSSGLSDSSVFNPLATPAVTTIYSVTVTDTMTQCSSSENIEISVINTPYPGTITPFVSYFCGGDTVNLSLDGFTSGASVQWQKSIDNGDNFEDIPGENGETLHIYTDSSTLYVAKVSCTDTSFSEAASVSILEIPEAPLASSMQRCSPGKVDLTAQGSGGNLAWYDMETGGNYLGSGVILTSPFINQSDTFWVEEGPPLPAQLSSSFLGGNSEDGNMFDITALQDITIHSFDAHLKNLSDLTVEIYYRNGSYVGFENDKAAWTFAGSVNDIQGLGTGVPTPVPLEMNVIIPEGKTYGFYITTKLNAMNFSAGTVVGAVEAEDDYLQIKEGAALNADFGTFTTPQQWNGTVHYSVIGCSGPRTPVPVTIYYPQITASSSETTVCSGDTISLYAINNGPGDFNYQWFPILPIMIPADGTGDTVLTAPVFPTTFTLIATEENNQCDTVIEWEVFANPTPVVSFSGLPDTMLVTDSQVQLTGDPPGGTFTGTGIVNGSFFDPALAGTGGPYPITYSYTNSFGCSDDTTMLVVVMMTSGTTGESGFTIDIFPNPATDQLHLSITGIQPDPEIFLEVFDLLGRKIFEQHMSDTESLLIPIDVSAWPKGNYFLRVNSGTVSYSGRIIIQ